MNIKGNAVSFVAAAALAFVPSAHAGDLHQKIQASEVVDLTHDMYEGMTFWPGGVPFNMTKVVDYSDYGYRLFKFTTGENTGTHADAPAHYIPDGATMDEIQARDLVLPTVVIDVQKQAEQDPDYRLTAERIRQWEKQHGKVPENALVIMNSGWHEKFESQDAYANQDEDGTLHFPGFGMSAAKLLLQRNVKAIATDTLSLDAGEAGDFPVHKLMLDEGIWGMENLTNLDQLPATGATVVAGALPVRGGTQAQARVFALLP